MIRKIIFYLILIIAISNIHGQQSKSKIGHSANQNEFAELNDGPYIFIEKNRLVEKKIIHGEVFTNYLNSNSYDTIYSPEQVTYNNIKKIGALSDIHGQYDLAVEVLRSNKIIDENLNWIYGNGHLVIDGDIFDRGNKINETLWLVYNLENEAREKGGRVHFLLGNHEYMILHNNLKYVHKKYKLTTKLLNTNYSDLYGKGTVIGRWLRSKPTVIKINNIIFVHGGISKEFISSGFNIEEINEVMRNSIERSKDEMKSSGFYDFYYGKKGPIWYRGYFEDDMTEKEILYILKQTNSEHIVVGHSSQKEIVQLFDNKIFGIDSRIKNGKYGEILLILDNKFYRGTLDGKNISFD